MSNGQDKKGISKAFNDRFKTAFGKDHPLWVEPEKPSKETDKAKALSRLDTQSFLGKKDIPLDLPYPGSNTAISDSITAGLKKRAGIDDEAKTQKQLAEDQYFRFRTAISKGSKLSKKQQFEYDELHKYFGKKHPDEYDAGTAFSEELQKTLNTEALQYEIDPDTGEILKDEQGKPIPNKLLQFGEEPFLERSQQKIAKERALIVEADKQGLTLPEMKKKIAKNIETSQGGIAKFQETMIANGWPERSVLYFEDKMGDFLKEGMSQRQAAKEAMKFVMGVYQGPIKQ